jgi:hypothetical protein
MNSFEKDKPLNSVDEHVKYFLCNFYPLGNSRIKILSDVLLTNSGEWVKNADGEYEVFLDKYESYPDIAADHSNTSIPMLKDDDIKYMSEFEIAYENGIRTTINSVLDQYCKKGFDSRSSDFRPLGIRSFTKSYCLIGSAPDDITSEWKDAILEVCDYYFQALNPAGMIQRSREVLDYLRRYNPKVAGEFLILMNTHERFFEKTKSNNSDAFLSKFLPTYEDLYKKNGFEDKCSFKRFKDLMVLRKNNSDLMLNAKDYINIVLRFEEKYITNGKFNETLIKRLEDGLNRVSWNYLQISSIVSQATHGLGVPSIYMIEVTNWYRDKVSSDLAACS